MSSPSRLRCFRSRVAPNPARFLLVVGPGAHPRLVVVLVAHTTRPRLVKARGGTHRALSPRVSWLWPTLADPPVLTVSWLVARIPAHPWAIVRPGARPRLMVGH